MALRVVTNKRLDMNDVEWEMYQNIVKSYTTSTNKGEDLFLDLFETDGAGVITVLRPPSARRTTLEIFLFLMALMQGQHLRRVHEEVADIVGQMKTKMTEIDQKLSKLK